MTFNTRATMVFVAVLAGHRAHGLRAAATRHVYQAPGAGSRRPRRAPAADAAPDPYRPSPPTSASSAAIRRAATPTTRSGRAASSRAWRGSGSARTPTSERPCGSSSSCRPDTRRALCSPGVDQALARFEAAKAVPTSGTRGGDRGRVIRCSSSGAGGAAGSKPAEDRRTCAPGHRDRPRHLAHSPA